MNQPNPNSKGYEELLAEVRSGRIKIPQFQREFVWERERSAKLLDSILKGYPIGTFILWKTKERLRAVRDIGGIKLPEPPEGDYTFQVLDGQQRLTSLFASLEGAKVARGRDPKDKSAKDRVDDFGLITVDLSVDPDGDERVVYASPEELPAGHRHCTFKELRTAEAFELNERYDNDNALLKRFAGLKKRLTTYRFSTIEIADVPLDVATEVFTRLNVGGRELTVFEIMVAKTMGRSGELRPRSQGASIQRNTGGQELRGNQPDRPHPDRECASEEKHQEGRHSVDDSCGIYCRVVTRGDRTQVGYRLL